MEPTNQIITSNFGPALHEAVRDNDIAAVGKILSERANVNFASEKRNPLELALQLGFPEIARLLREHGGKFHASKDIYSFVLNAAAETSDELGVKLLLENGFDMSVQFEDGCTPLHLSQTSKVTEIILAKGAKINARNGIGETPIHVAIKCGLLDTARYLANHGADVNLPDNDEDTPLHAAAVRSEMSELMGILLAKGARMNEKGHHGRTPINLAVRYGFVDNARCLANHGSDVNLPDKDENTPLHAAAGWSELSDAIEPGMSELIETLLVKGARVNDKGFRGRTPIYIAAKCGALDNVRCLVSHGADVNLPGIDMSTPLHAAVSSTNSCGSIAEILIANGADVNARTILGRSPLHCLDHSDYSDHQTKIMVEKLLEHEVDINVQDSDGKTPLHCAAHLPDIVGMYLKRGANINIETSEGETPLEFARSMESQVENKTRFQLTSEYLVRNIIKLRVVGLNVSKKNSDMANSIMSRPKKDKTIHSSNEQLHEYNQQCELESYKLKLNVGILLRYFLTTKYPSYLSNTELCERLDKINCSDYPVYGDMILDKLKRDKRRFVLLEQCKSLFTRSEIEPALPEEMWEKILSELSVTDLKRVLEGFKGQPRLNKSL